VKALKDLIADGYLNVKPGCLGTFTNPGRFESMGDVKLIGVLTFDGKTVFDVKLCEEFRHAFSKILLRKSAGYKIQGCFLNGSLSRADEELGLLGLDAIVWFCPTAQAMPAIGRLRASGRIVICAGNVQDECNAIYFDTENLTRRVARLILKEGRRKIMLALPPSANFAPDSIAGLRGAYEEACLPFDQDAQLFIAPLDALDAFSAKIEKLKPTPSSSAGTSLVFGTP
jgi:DNA-binding LacI/PurR family transcriptional regulator